MHDVLAWIGAGTVCCFLVVAAWIAANELGQRAEARRAARNPTVNPPEIDSYPPVLEYLPAEVNPHPDKHPTLHVDARSPAEAWAAISRRAS
jgi:hypothetical protein